MADTLFQKVWNAHAVRMLPSGQTQLFVGLHLVHEVTTPQAFDMLRQHGWRVAFPDRTFATVDHIVPTSTQQRPFLDVMAEEMTTALERNCRDAGIRRLGVQGGVGYAYEYGGSTIDAMTIDERMTICNMSIEGGARVGYVNPDETTFAFLRGRRFAPAGAAFDRAVAWWRQMASDPGASYDDRVTLQADGIEPTVTRGLNAGQSVGVGQRV